MSHTFWSPHTSLRLGVPGSCPHQPWRGLSPALGLLPQAAGTQETFPTFQCLPLSCCQGPGQAWAGGPHFKPDRALSQTPLQWGGRLGPCSLHLAPPSPSPQVPRPWSQAVRSHQEHPCPAPHPALSRHPAAHGVGVLEAGSGRRHAACTARTSPPRATSQHPVPLPDIHNFSR